MVVPARVGTESWQPGMFSELAHPGLSLSDIGHLPVWEGGGIKEVTEVLLSSHKVFLGWRR